MKIIFKNNKLIISILLMWLIFILGIAINSDLIKHFNLTDGYKLGNDSKFLLSEAKKISEGLFPLNNNATSYLGIIYLLSFFEYFTIQLKFFVYFQILLTFVSALCLYKITFKIFCKEAGIIALILFLFYFPIQIRNFYILTDLIFIDLTIIIFFFIIFINKIHLVLAVLFTIINLFVRPHGTIIIPSIFIVVLFYLYFEKKHKIFYFVFVLGFIISIPLIYFTNILLKNEDVVGTLLKGDIIWGFKFKMKISIKS